jgi:hypothetical protein
MEGSATLMMVKSSDDHELRHRQDSSSANPARGLPAGAWASRSPSRAPFRLVSASPPLADRLGPGYLDTARTWRDLS